VHNGSGGSDAGHSDETHACMANCCATAFVVSMMQSSEQYVPPTAWSGAWRTEHGQYGRALQSRRREFHSER
jgi:hypothetical protein